MNIHEQLHLRMMLKGFLKIMNDIPYSQRDEDITKIRAMISKKYDAIGDEAFKNLRQIDPDIPEN